MTRREMWNAARLGLIRTWQTSKAHTLSMAIASQVIALVPAGLATLSGTIVSDVTELLEAGSPQFESILPWLILTSTLLMVIGLSEVARRYSQDRLADEMGLIISQDVLNHAATLDLAFFDQKENHDMLSRASRYPGRGYLLFVASIFGTFTSALQFVSLLGVMLWIEPRVTLVLASVTVPFLFFRWRMAEMKFFFHRAKTRKRRQSGYFSSLITSRGIVPTTRLYGLSPLLLGRFKETMRDLIDTDRYLYRRMALGKIALSISFSLVFLLATGTVISLTLAGTIGLGSLVTYIASAIAFRTTSSTLVNTVTEFMQRVLFVRDLHEFMELRPEIVDGADAPKEPLSGRIDLKGVWFTYPGTTRPTIQDLHLSIDPGETIAIVGPNGAGKTTLVKLIARLYEADQGVVQLDGHDVRELKMRWLYDQVAYVGQMPVKFEATIEENIAFGDWKRLIGDSDAVAEIADQAGLSALLENAPDGLQTVLGRRFGNYDLSGGQWQLLALARAMARNAPLVILDEPTSNLDAKTEYETFRRFHQLSQGRTTLLVSHRFSTVRMADRIFVVDDGRVVEKGTHDALMAEGGVYSTLYAAHRMRYESAPSLEPVEL